MEFLVDITVNVPAGTSPETVEATRRAEAVRARELAAQGTLLRLWRPPHGPGEWRTTGLFSAPDKERAQEAVASLPLYPWMTIAVTPLTPHPNDPAAGD